MAMVEKEPLKINAASTEAVPESGLDKVNETEDSKETEEQNNQQEKESQEKKQEVTHLD